MLQAPFVFVTSWLLIHTWQGPSNALVYPLPPEIIMLSLLVNHCKSTSSCTHMLVHITVLTAKWCPNENIKRVRESLNELYSSFKSPSAKWLNCDWNLLFHWFGENGNMFQSKCYHWFSIFFLWNVSFWSEKDYFNIFCREKELFLCTGKCWLERGSIKRTAGKIHLLVHCILSLA